MYKLPDETIHFIKKTMETWRVELTARGKSLAEVKIQRGILQGHTLSPLLFVIAMMPLNHVLRKSPARYKLRKSQEKINHLMYMNDIKLFAKSKRELATRIPTVRIYSQDVGMESSSEKCTILITKSGKRHMTEGIEIPNREKNQKRNQTNTWECWKLTPSNRWIWKEKIKKEYLRKTRKLLEHEPNQRDKYLDSFPRKIFRPVFEVDQRRP